MKKFAILISLISLIGFSNASEYTSNKKYTYSEVAEILSEKIIEDREKILKLENELSELKNKIYNIELTTKKYSNLNDTNKKIVQKPMSEIKEPEFKPIQKNSNNQNEISNKTIKNIEISTELYKKVQ